MVDSMGSGDTPSPIPAPPKPKSPVTTFFASSTGRLMAGGVLLFTVVVVAGAFLFFSLLNPKVPESPVVPNPSGSTLTSETALEATRPPNLPLDDTFTFRNVFVPSVRPPVAAVTASSTQNGESSSSSDDEEDSDSSIPADTLVLQSIANDSGERVASMSWNGTVYEVREGEQVDDSPWEVVTIFSDSVLMLFGDSRVTLTVGQGFSK